MSASADRQLQLEKFSSWHSDCTIDNYLCGNGKTIDHPGGNWARNRTCYGTIKIPSNKQYIIATWKIKIVSMSAPTYVCIGIDSIERTGTFFAGNKNASNYGYGDDGKMYASGIVKTKKQKYGKDDLIILKLNTALGVLQCYRNGLAEEALQHSFPIKKHPDIAYKLAISIKRAKVSIVGFNIESHKVESKQEASVSDNKHYNTQYQHNQYQPSAPPESQLEEKTNDIFYNNNSGVVWQIKLGGEWKDYDGSVSQYIESKYCQQNMKIFECKIRNTKYYINLDSMTQSNSNTGRKRDIRRFVNNNNNSNNTSQNFASQNNYTSQNNQYTSQQQQQNQYNNTQQQNQYNNQNNEYNQQYYNNQNNPQYTNQYTNQYNNQNNQYSSGYKNWNVNTIIGWIGSLENGRYVKYLDVLKNGFVKSDITKGECLADVDASVLSVEPFNISSFPDKRDLVKQFKKLNQGYYL